MSSEEEERATYNIFALAVYSNIAALQLSIAKR